MKLLMADAAAGTRVARALSAYTSLLHEGTAHLRGFGGASGGTASGCVGGADATWALA